MTLHQFFNICLLHFYQFISSLAAVIWESDLGGPVEEAEKVKVELSWKVKLEDLGSNPALGLRHFFHSR